MGQDIGLGDALLELQAPLGRLRVLGCLEQHGERGGATYSIARELSPPAGLRLKPEEPRKLILELARMGPITNEFVRNRTGLDRATTLRILTELADDGLLVRQGERRGTRYTRTQE